MPPVPPRSAGGQATTGIVWSNYGPASPVGCGMPKTQAPVPTAFLSRYQQTKWLRSVPITVTMPPYRSIGVCGTSHKPTAARPRHGNIPNKSVGTDRLRSPQGTHAYERHHSRHWSPVRCRRYPSYRGRCRHQPHQEIRAELRHRPRHGPSYRTRGGSDRCRSCHGSRPRPGIVDAGDFGNRRHHDRSRNRSAAGRTTAGHSRRIHARSHVTTHRRQSGCLNRHPGERA